MKTNNKNNSVITSMDLEEVATLVSGSQLIIDSVLLLIEEEGTPTNLDAARELIAKQMFRAMDKLSEMQAELHTSVAVAAE
jgi:hypothetical protein